jgi:hypothetical protein
MPEIKVRLPQEHTGDDHEAIHLHVTEQESILWTCSSEDFEILRIRKDPAAPKSLRNPNAPGNPFYRPFGSGKAKGRKGGCLCSGPVRPEAINQQYKFTYRVGNKKYDPHIITHR